MALFETKLWKMHSGAMSHFKIECDTLSNEDIDTLAQIISQKCKFTDVYGVPTGGTRLANVLEKYKSLSGCKLIVDDVLTTGSSMEQTRVKLNWLDAIGVVIFARSKCPDWITPIFQMWEQP